MRRGRTAALLAAAVLALGAGQAVQVAAPTTEQGEALQRLIAKQASGEKQAPAQAAQVPAALRFLADLGAPFGNYPRASGCPWPGRAAARSRRGPGAFWSGR